MMTKIRDLMARREAGEKGFTLVELLVVIIIIGILAAVAIPIFLNQQKSAVDSATTSDVRNVATNMETLRVQNPMADEWAITTTGTGTETIYVGTTDVSGTGADGEVEVSLSEGTVISVSAGTVDGTFTVEGYNPNGNAKDAATAITYNSATGGLN